MPTRGKRRWAQRFCNICHALLRTPGYSIEDGGSRSSPCGGLRKAPRGLNVSRLGSGDRALDAIEQIVHLVKEWVEVVVCLGNNHVAFVVLQRTDVNRHLVLQVGDSLSGGTACSVVCAGAEWGVLHHVGL